MLQINGTTNHIHMLVSLHPSISLSNFIKELKNSTNYWIKKHDDFEEFESWGRKYAAFTCNSKDIKRITDYISNQRNHNNKTTFEKEYLKLIEEERIEINPKYFLKDDD